MWTFRVLGAPKRWRRVTIRSGRSGKRWGDSLLIGIFDHEAYDLRPADGVEKLEDLIPNIGGGGTNFHRPFELIGRIYSKDEIAGIIMITDGYGEFPPESIANGVPVLWITDNDDVTPPWGLHTKIY